MNEDNLKEEDGIYTEEEMQQLIESLKHSYQYVRLVDPDECRALSFSDEGKLEYGNTCYSVWGINSRCSHCTSFQACKSNRECDRREKINGQVWNIRALPVRIHLKDDTRYSCTLEMIQKEAELSPAEIQAEENVNSQDYLLFHDILTGLYNEDGMHRRIRMELQNHPDTDYVLVLTDVRRFRLVNDLFGTNAGNDVLMKIAHLLEEDTGEDAVLSRVRGDQFVMFVPAAQFDENSFVGKIQRAEKLMELPYYRLHLHAAAFPVTSKNRNLPVSVMVDRARLALEKIKTNEQVNLVWFEESMLDETLREQRIVSSFPADLANGEYTIYLQPQVESNGRVIGAEALVRRVKPDGTVIFPGDFIPVLEKSDLISRLDVYVWELAAKTLASWKGTALQDCYISVNVSPRDSYYIDIAGTLSDLCRKYDIDNRMLHVEITETGLMKNMEMHTSIIDELHDQGFIVEIDDFGKGTSSLGVLRNVDADVVKLDMSFLHNKGNEHKRDIILSSVIDMTRQLGMNVLTEGVETEDQEKSLETMGCFLYQGFYFSKAVPIHQFEEAYKKHMA